MLKENLAEVLLFFFHFNAIFGEKEANQAKNFVLSLLNTNDEFVISSKLMFFNKRIEKFFHLQTS